MYQRKKKTFCEELFQETKIFDHLDYSVNGRAINAWDGEKRKYNSGENTFLR